MAYVADAVTLSSTMRTCSFECTDVINLEMAASNTIEETLFAYRKIKEKNAPTN
jgi:hypothetical protein